jgi:hypothetical protein
VLTSSGEGALDLRKDVALGRSGLNILTIVALLTCPFSSCPKGVRRVALPSAFGTDILGRRKMRRMQHILICDLIFDD